MNLCQRMGRQLRKAVGGIPGTKQNRYPLEILEDRCVPAYSGLGSEFLLNQFTTNEQGYTASAMDSNGNFVVVWESVNQAGGSSGRDIYGRLYNAAGAALGNEFLVNTYTTNNQSKARVAMSSTGSFVVTWQSSGQDGDGDGVYMQRFNASGVKQGSETLVNSGQTADDQQVPDVGMDSSGNFIIVWQSGDINTYSAGDGDFLTPGFIGVFAQRYTSTGAANGSRFRVNQAVTGPQALPTVAVNASGSFVITFSSIPDINNTNDVRVLARRGTLSGGISGSEFQVDQGGSTEQFGSDVAIDTNGNFVITWASTQDESGLSPRRNNVYARRYNSAGTAQGSEFRVNSYVTGDQLQPQVVMDASGNFVIAFQSGLKPESSPTPADQPDGNLYGVYARRYSAAGTADGNEFLVNETTTSSQFFPAISMRSSNGDFLISWSSGGAQDGNSYGNYAKRFASSNANPIATVGGPYTIDEGSSLALSAAGSSDPEGQTLTYAWDVNGDGIYTDASGVAPTLTWNQLNALGILDGPDSRNVSVRVSDPYGGVTTSSTVSLNVQSVAPTVSINGWNFLVRGQARDFYFSATDPSPADLAANMTYNIDWDGDGNFDQVLVGSAFGEGVSYIYTASGAYTLRVTATDQNGVTSAVVTLPVTVVDWALLPDPNDNAKTDLHWGAPDAASSFFIAVELEGQLKIFDFSTGTPTPTPGVNGTIYFYGQGGSDVFISVDNSLDMVFSGGEGDDTLAVMNTAGRSITLDGGIGNDLLYAVDSVNATINSYGGLGDDGLFVYGGTNVVANLYGNENDDLFTVTDIVGSTVKFFGDVGNDTSILINDSPNNVEMYGGDGDDLLLAVVGPVYMEGGSGSDLIVAGFVDANDTLLGGDGNDVLIGSGGTDQLEGGEGEDLLVAAGFLFQEEEDPGDFLFAIWAEWGSSRTYAERVANISGTGAGPRNNGDYFIEPGVNIVNDDAVDVVLGEDDQDWLVYDFALDIASDWQVTEVKTNIG